MLKYPVRISREGKHFLAEFPDVPIAHSFGETKEECLHNALEALETAIVSLMSDRAAIPAPSRGGRGIDSVVLPALSEAKIALYQSMRGSGLRKADLARRLGWHKPQVDRLLDLRHDSRIDQIEQASIALGKRLSITLHDAA